MKSESDDIGKTEKDEFRVCVQSILDMVNTTLSNTAEARCLQI